MRNSMGEIVLAALAVGLFAATATADTTPAAKETGPKADATEVKSAVVVNFAGELGLEFPSLKTLGVRIDQARDNPDPVGLAVAAAELAAAEAASGKAASVTSADLTKEAVEMAMNRQSLRELRAVSQLVTDAATRKKLEEHTAAVQQGVAAAKAGERGKGVGTLIVYNNAQRTVAIYANDQFLGNVRANNEGTFQLGHTGYEECGNYVPGYPTTLMARSGAKRWGPRTIERDLPTCRWTLNPLKE